MSLLHFHRELSPHESSRTGSTNWKTAPQLYIQNEEHVRDVWGRGECKEDSEILWNIYWGADSLWAICNLATGVEAKTEQSKGQRCEKSVET